MLKASRAGPKATITSKLGPRKQVGQSLPLLIAGHRNSDEVIGPVIGGSAVDTSPARIAGRCSQKA